MSDIQFYREIGSQADDINMKGRGHDYDEYEMELKEQKRIDNMNKEFIRFTKKVEDLDVIKFELPFRELEFTGVPFKSNVTIFPTRNCIISLSELPFFVITVQEIELVYFERVSQNLKNFDMAFVFKDYSRPIKKISAIPIENLDMLKTWLDDNDILFSEGQFNLSWPKIMNIIKETPQDFIEGGCWNFLTENVNEEEEEEEPENDDPEYEEEEIESSEDEDEYEQEEEEESLGEDEGDDVLSEEGEDWDEMEEKAKKDDNAKKMKEKENFKKNNRNKKKK